MDLFGVRDLATNYALLGRKQPNSAYLALGIDTQQLRVRRSLATHRCRTSGCLAQSEQAPALKYHK